jgi:hypothetical protein
VVLGFDSGLFPCKVASLPLESYPQSI